MHVIGILLALVSFAGVGRRKTMKSAGRVARFAMLGGFVMFAGACGTYGEGDEPVAEVSSPLDEGALASVDGDDATSDAPAGDSFASTDVAAACTETVATGRELMIRNLGVVEDAVRTRWTGGLADPKDGAWTFGRLMRNMAGANDPELFVRSWLSRWETDRTVNGFVVPARPNIKPTVISGWPKLASGQLDLKKAPMRLLAIVNRMDLRNLSAGNAGEGRFVFGVTDSAGNALSFTVILEYKLPAASLTEAQEWAKQWHALGTMTPGTAAYNDALQKITDRFAGRDAAPTRPNGSSIGQVRTNEIAIGSPWELREFRLNANGQLVQAAVAQSPSPSLRTSARLARWINANETALLEGRHTVPMKFEDLPFRGGRAVTDFATWNPAGVNNPEARHLLAVNTCDGCHGGETGTGFLHVSPRAKGQVAPISGFLTGTTVSDPVSGKSRTFDDLARRKNDFATFLCTGAAAPSGAAARVH
jgi:hypothetical protein